MLDFLVVGAQKGGTTTLWDLLRDHPDVWLPATKEAPFFSHTPVYDRGLEHHLASLGAPRKGPRLLGTVTPHYMHGWQDATTSVIASRIAGDLPNVRIIALLREPVARARSQHAMAFARGRDVRDAERALSEELGDDALRAARAAPNDINTYVIQGEYSRILGEYLEVLPRTALHVDWTDSFASEPLAVLRRIESFLGISERWTPEDPSRRLFVGGKQDRVDHRDIADLLATIESGESSDPAAVVRAWLAARGVERSAGSPVVRAAERIARSPVAARRHEIAGLRFLLTKTSNFRPSAPDPISDDLRQRLVAHYRADSAMLQSMIGVDPPWQLSPTRAL